MMTMPCTACRGFGVLTGWFLDSGKAEETRVCRDCLGTGEERDYLGEEIEREAKAPRRCLAVYNPTTRQWWPAPYQPTPGGTAMNPGNAQTEPRHE
jgi:hypothetical protein